MKVLCSRNVGQRNFGILAESNNQLQFVLQFYFNAKIWVPIYDLVIQLAGLFLSSK
jgi:hypothetical protein